MKEAWGLFKQKFSSSVFFLLFATMVACSSLSVKTPSPLITDITPIYSATAYPDQTPTVTILPSNPASEVIATPITINPETMNLTPDKREVNLADLGLSDSTRLILYYQASNSLRTMSGKDIQPQKIPNINPKANFSNINLREISPDQKWFTYSTFKEMKGNSAYYDYWISSVDGKRQWVIASDISAGIHPQWVTNQKIELWDYSFKPCPKRTEILDPFSKESVIPPDVPDSPSPQCFFPLSTNPDRSKMIYLDGTNLGLWSIYDFATGTKHTVFPWLSQSEAGNLWSRYIQWLPSGITFALPNHESINFVIDLSPSDASDINSQWYKMVLPLPDRILDNRISWWQLDEGLIGFDMVETDPNYLDDLKTSPASKFVVIDLRHSILYDYSLDRANAGDRQKVSSFFVSSSADNRFLAWTIYEPPDMSHASETVVLERSTGRIARIKGFEFFGWGEVQQP